MTKARIAGAVFAAALLLLAAAAAYTVFVRNPGGGSTTAKPAAETPAIAEEKPGFIYGRITSITAGTYEGRIRWGGAQEAFWGDYFNGQKRENKWAAQVPADRLPTERRPKQIFGISFAGEERPIDLDRLFMVRFGDIARIEAVGRDVVRVTLKSGTVFDLNRMDASDFDDGVRVWDQRRGVVDLDSLLIRSIELLPTTPLVDAPDRLHGTVRAGGREFTGFIQWNRQAGAGVDTLDGRSADGDVNLRFETIRSIARESSDSARAALLDGREIVLSGTPDVGKGNRGVYVDDPRYGRVLISWDAFERIDFTPAGSGPGYAEFPPGHPLQGVVTTRDGRRIAGRLVYDLDESETTETLDAPAAGVDYTILFGLVRSIFPGAGDRATVTLHSGEALELRRAGDLADQNAGVLVFTEGSERPDYVRWSEVERIELDRPPAMYPPIDMP